MPASNRTGACLLTLSLISVSFGVLTLLFDMNNFLNMDRESLEFTRAATASRSKAQRILSIVLGFFSVWHGVLGITGYCFTNRAVVTVFIAGLCLDFFLRLLLISLVLLSSNRAQTITLNSMSRVIQLYGYDKNNTGLQFTVALKKYAEKEQCCGWAGAKAKESLFEASVWHQRLSSQPEVEAERRLDIVEGRPVKILLPTPCCTWVQQHSDTDTKVVSAPSAAGYCSDIYDLTTARNQGAIHAKDCLDLLVAKMKTLLGIYAAIHVATLLFNVTSAATGSHYLKAMFLELSKADRKALELAAESDDDDLDDEVEAAVKDVGVNGKGQPGRKVHADNGVKVKHLNEFVK